MYVCVYLYSPYMPLWCGKGQVYLYHILVQVCIVTTYM